MVKAIFQNCHFELSTERTDKFEPRHQLSAKCV